MFNLVYTTDNGSICHRLSESSYRKREICALMQPIVRIKKLSTKTSNRWKCSGCYGRPM